LTDPPRKPKRFVTVYTVDQAAKFLDACGDHRLGPLFATMLGTGLRFGEALGLKWEFVDIDRRIVRVVSARQRVMLDDVRPGCGS
jgi:integrase